MTKGGATEVHERHKLFAVARTGGPCWTSSGEQGRLSLLRVATQSRWSPLPQTPYLPTLLCLASGLGGSAR